MYYPNAMVLRICIKIANCDICTLANGDVNFLPDNIWSDRENGNEQLIVHDENLLLYICFEVYAVAYKSVL